MPKKSATARNGAQHHRPRTQKSFELLHPVSQEQALDAEQGTEAVITQVSTAPEVQKASTPTPKESASTRLAARRQAMQRNQQRQTAVLITADHFAYVRKDLIIIAALATIMFSAIVILYFVLGAGA